MANKYEIHRYRRNADGTVVVSEERLRILENTAKRLDEGFREQRRHTGRSNEVIMSQNDGKLITAPR